MISRKKIRKIKPEPENPHWHEHLCLMHRLGKEMYDAFCPWKDEVIFGPESGDDYCDYCPYNIRVDFDAQTGLVQIWGDANVLNPAYDFTNYTVKKGGSYHGSHS